ncbi:MAG: discoidin domain-containing protein, partial [Spirochaetales bacterium]|nr:discoidin domain-containing protein [Spirochaetales bacterium]
NENTDLSPDKAVDGSTSTRWASAFSDPQWIMVDLGAVYNITRVVLVWETACASAYQIQVSSDGTTWTTIYSTTSGDGGTDDLSVSGTGRYVRVYCTARATGWGNSLWELEIYGPGGNTSPPTNTPTGSAPVTTATATPTPITITPGPVDFGPNVYIFDPSMSSSSIQSINDTIYNQQAGNQFGSQRYAFLFKPGSYNVNVAVGFYTSVVGLGQRPDDVTITGSVRCEADWMGGNATCNFWRTAENYSVIPTYSANPVAPSGTETWGASQAAPMRRVHIRGNLTLWDPNPDNYDGSWSSGGFIVDSRVDGQISSASQQQYFSRNTQMGSWVGANWNMFFLGDVGNPGASWPDPPYTVVGQTPVIREKPFLYVDGSGSYFVFKPAIRTNSQGITWANGIGSGTSLPISQFYIAKPGDSAATMNNMLKQGLNLLITPGIYEITEPIQVNRADTIVMGMGLATLMPVNGTAAIKVADVDGVTIAGFLLDAGAVNSPVLLEVGPRGSSQRHSGNPTFIFDVFCRVGGAAVGRATNCVEINSHDTVVDHFWLWRADHGTGVGWTVNTTTNGLIVNANYVTIYGLFVEHFHEYQTVWNGNNGRTYFYQSECPYDAPNQASWMNGSINGYASYKVANSVTSHEAWGLGVYCVYTVDLSIKCHSAMEAPVNSGVRLHHLVTVSLGGQGEITHVINEIGGPSNTATNIAKVAEFP